MRLPPAESSRSPTVVAPSESEDALAELQGLYGPFAFSELLLQKLWWRREFDVARACTMDRRAVRVLSPGRWNRLGGPDFREAVLEIEGVRLRGDVEVHLHAGDWDAHRHAQDPAYDHVVLHVVLFPPRTAETRGVGGRAIPILPLLPLLWHDLEEYATDEAVAALLNRADHRMATELAPLPPPVLWSQLRGCAERRWQAKVRYAGLRVAKLGWDEACHQGALEVLGYRSNRAGMLRLAAAWPLTEWRRVAPEPAELFEQMREAWVLQGVRPANHPRTRLRQYTAWVAERPAWPDHLLEWARLIDDRPGDSTGAVARGRRRLEFPSRWRAFQAAVGGAAISGPRANNLVSDAFIPLLVARGDLIPQCGFDWWWHGYIGDLPDAIRRALRELGLGGTATSPAALGPAQGLLGWLLERELAEQRALASDAPGSGA